VGAPPSPGRVARGSLLGAATRPQPHASRSGRGGPCPAARPPHRRADRRRARDGALDGVADLQARGSRAPSPPRARRARRRYERRRAGELIHVDVKKLGRIDRVGHRISGRCAGHHRARGAGWDYLHVIVDDATRIAYAEILADEHPAAATGFLRRAVAYLASLGIAVERLITDNGNAYRSTVHAIACRELGIRHIRTRPYTPRTNGKAERFIKTLVDGWAYDAIYGSSRERAQALPAWLDRYNRKRPHRSIGRMPPMDRLAELNANNVVGAHT
jgi:transposase InsO family protein